MPEEAGRVTDAVLAAALRGSGGTPPKAEWPALLASADDHGVLPLLADAAAAARWDKEIVAAMRPALAAETALAMLRERELHRVLASLAAHGVTPLLLKGAHLAFAVYRSPDRRPRLDTDLLIKDDDREAVQTSLKSLGYERQPFVSGDIAFTQFQFWRLDESGARHTLDVHWRIANPRVFADRLIYGELMRDAIALPQLGPHAFAPSMPHALLIACLHRTAHHGTSTRLVWLYDIHLIASRLTEGDWIAVIDKARRRGLASVIAAGLVDATERLATVVPRPVLDALHAEAPAAHPDVQAFLRGTPPKLLVALSDWCHIRGWRSRLRFALEHLFPSADYMRYRYDPRSDAALPFLYAHRIVTGAWAWLRRLKG
jgi:hypothetical protein